jgi:ribosomal protein S18 acetylase RimI-like enzyme
MALGKSVRHAGHDMNEVLYRPMIAQDSRPLLELFGRIRPSIARVANRSAHRAIIGDALHAKDAVIIVAVKEHFLVGYVIAATNWKHFRRTFFVRHPLVVLSAAANFIRARTRLAAKNPPPRNAPPLDADRLASAADNACSWNDSDSSIAKILHVGVDDRAREQGVAQGLYRGLIDVLRKRGFARLDARISATNTASINLHRKLGFVVKKAGDGYFAYLLIAQDRSTHG